MMPRPAVSAALSTETLKRGAAAMGEGKLRFVWHLLQSGDFSVAAI